MSKKKSTLTINVTSGLTHPPCVSSAMEEYTDKYFKAAEINSTAKVYIPQELHSTLRRLVKTVNIAGVSLSSFVTSILYEHINQNASVMQNIYDDNIEELF